jgi:hypothetical protein
LFWCNNLLTSGDGEGKEDGASNDASYNLIETIPISRIACHLGGSCPYFLCPGAGGGGGGGGGGGAGTATVNNNNAGCRRQVSKLYFSQRRFLCRCCSRLSYACQLEQPWQRAHRRASNRANKLWRRLDRLSNATAITAGVSAEVLQARYEYLLGEALLAGTQATQVHTDRLLRLAAWIEERSQRRRRRRRRRGSEPEFTL